MIGLTKRQREIVDFIEEYLAEKKHSPSYRDIQRRFGFASLGSVYNHVQSLKTKGVLPENTTRSRSLVLVGENKGGTVEVPLIGMLRGGMPIETYPQMASLALAEHMVPSSQACYLLRVAGRELLEESIQEGDLLLIRGAKDFEDRAMVLAQVRGQTTFVKRAVRSPPFIHLESGNPQVHPMTLREDHVEILGVVLSLIRNYSS
ncbi:transcriptional repressor LexA [Chlamydiota bacterium]